MALYGRKQNADMLSPFSFHPPLIIRLAAWLGIMASLASPAADGSWLSGQTGTLNWSDSANWTGGIVPGAVSGSSSGDTATFGSNTAATLITIDSGRIVLNLTFNGTNAAGAFTLGSAGVNLGPTLHLSSGGTALSQPGTLVPVTVHAPLVIEPASPTGNGIYTFTNNSTTAPDAFTNSNLYKMNLLGDISGGVTTGSITLNFTGTAGVRGVDASANIVSGLISDGGAAGGLGISVTGSGGGNFGAWSFTNNSNSFTGPVTLSAGTLITSSLGNIGQNSAIGAGSSIQLNSGAQFKIAGPATSTDRTINSISGVIYAVSNPVTLNGAITMNSLTFRGGSNFIVNSVISGTGNLSRTDGGTVFLNQNNTFNGGVTIQDGAFRVSSIANGGVASPLGSGTFIQLGQNSSTVGRLEFDGPSGGSSNREIRLSNGAGASSGNGRINSLTAGQTLTLSGTVRATSTTASHVSALNLTGVGNGILSGVVGGLTGAPTTANNMSLTKNGTGTWVLSAANIYYGATNITDGTLLAMNSTGSATGTGNVTTSASGILGGTGFIIPAAGNSITIGTGSSLQIGTTHGVVSGQAGAAGTTAGPGVLTLGAVGQNIGMTLAGNLRFDLFSGSDGITPGAADRLVIRSSAASLTGGGTVQVADTTGSVGWRAGTWTLADWSGFSGSLSTGFSFAMPTAPLASGYGWNTAQFTTTGAVFIEKTATNHTWTGLNSGSWADTGNWEVGTLPSGTTDVFFAALTPNSATQIDGDKTVRNLFFSGDSNVTVGTGSGGVLYSNGSLFEVLGGTHSISANLRPRATSGTTYHILNNGTLNFSNQILYHASSGTATLDLVFSGTGTTTVNALSRRVASYDMNVVVNGPGTLVLTSSNPNAAPINQGDGASGFITGTTTVTGGVLSLNSEANIGGNPAVFNPAHLTLSGGTLRARETFAIDDSNRGVTFGPGGASIEVETNRSLTLATAVTGAGALNKTGPGALILAGSSTHSGPTTVTSGGLQVGLLGVGETGTGALTLAASASLYGTGTVRADAFTAASGSFIHAGDGIGSSLFGTLTFEPAAGNGVFDFQSGSSVFLDIALTGEFDQLRFLGTGLNTLDFFSDLTIGPATLAPTNAMSFKVLDWTDLAFNPDFAAHFSYTNLLFGNGDELPGLNLPDISGSGFYWDMGGFTSDGVISLVVPEPSRAVLLLFAAALIMGRRSRR